MTSRRREFFHALLRWTGLTVLGLTAVKVTAKPGCRKPADPCGDCSQLASCELPKARQAKSPGIAAG